MWEFIGQAATPFFIATFKYMFSGFTALGFQLTFWEAFIVISSGASTSFLFFYSISGTLMRAAKRKKIEKARAEIAAGTFVPRKNFTRVNKFIVKLKMHKWGFWLLVGLGPLIMSVPLGSIVVAKFFGGQKKTVIYGVSALVFWGFILTCIAYIFS